MNKQPKLIFLNGFAGCGKTTVAKRYIEDHALALHVEGDALITMLGQWKEHLEEAAECRLALSEPLVRVHLERGYDVILPFLLLDVAWAERYERMAQDIGAQFFEIMLDVEKQDAIDRLFRRGTWGEDGLPPLGDHDLPKIKKLYDKMSAATKKRRNTQNIHPALGDIEGTYKQLLAIVER